MERVIQLPATKRLRAVMATAARLARHDGRGCVGVDDLREALSSAAGVSWRPRWLRLGPDLLDEVVVRWWRAAEREAALAGHPYLAPEHLLLVDAGEVERALLLAKLGGFPDVVRWRPRGPRSAARRRGRELTAARQRHAVEERGSNGHRGV